MIDAVVFDLDGVIIDSEQLWDEVREGLARERGGHWSEQAQADMMGMSSTEWSRYLHEAVGLAEPPEEINREVVRRMLDRYSERLPLIDGADDAVKRLAAHWPLGVASSSNRELIDRVLEVSGLAPYFKATVSSEEVERVVSVTIDGIVRVFSIRGSPDFLASHRFITTSHRPSRNDLPVQTLRVGWW